MKIQGSKCDRCGDFQSDIDVGFSLATHSTRHAICGGTYRKSFTEHCSLPECDNLAFRDGLCAACHATREAVRQDRERYKRTGELPPYVPLPRGPEEEDKEP